MRFRCSHPQTILAWNDGNQLDFFGFADPTVINGEQLFASGVQNRNSNVYRVLGDIDPRILAAPQEYVMFLRPSCLKFIRALVAPLNGSRSRQVLS